MDDCLHMGDVHESWLRYGWSLMDLGICKKTGVETKF